MRVYLGLIGAGVERQEVSGDEASDGGYLCAGAVDEAAVDGADGRVDVCLVVARGDVFAEEVCADAAGEGGDGEDGCCCGGEGGCGFGLDVDVDGAAFCGHGEKREERVFAADGTGDGLEVGFLGGEGCGVEGAGGEGDGGGV